jgi:rSAM/selenodomain-associated transferase 1
VDYLASAAARCAFAIMAKASNPGTCKTRLVPPLTYEEAAELNRCFLGDVSANVLTAGQYQPIDGFIAYATPESEPFFRQNLPHGMRLLPPRTIGLGNSLRRVSADLLAIGYCGICLINSDSPTLPTSILIETAEILLRGQDRLVLGPCTDGGYYLVGLNCRHDRLFDEISWSTDQVLRQTLERAREIDLAVIRMPDWYDVDDATSLKHLLSELAATPRTAQLTPFAAPLTRAHLRRSGPLRIPA